MTSMINLKASRKTGTINVGVNPITNINVNNPTIPHYNSPLQETFKSVMPEEPKPVDTVPSEFNASSTTSTNYLEQSEMVERLMREIKVLRLIIDIQHSNPMIVNKYIIADDDSLGKMVGLLCNASEVHLDADDVGVGCVTKKTYRKVNSIYVTVNGETLNLKYDFPAVMKQLKDLHISVKYVY